MVSISASGSSSGSSVGALIRGSARINHIPQSVLNDGRTRAARDATRVYIKWRLCEEQQHQLAEPLIQTTIIHALQINSNTPAEE